MLFGSLPVLKDLQEHVSGSTPPNLTNDKSKLVGGVNPFTKLFVNWDVVFPKGGWFSKCLGQ